MTHVTSSALPPLQPLRDSALPMSYATILCAVDIPGEDAPLLMTVVDFPTCTAIYVKMNQSANLCPKKALCVKDRTVVWSGSVVEINYVIVIISYFHMTLSISYYHLQNVESSSSHLCSHILYLKLYCKANPVILSIVYHSEVILLPNVVGLKF